MKTKEIYKTVEKTLIEQLSEIRDRIRGCNSSDFI